MPGATEARLSVAPLAGPREWALMLASERRMPAHALASVCSVLSSITIDVSSTANLQLSAVALSSRRREIGDLGARS